MNLLPVVAAPTSGFFRVAAPVLGDWLRGIPQALCFLIDLTKRWAVQLLGMVKLAGRCENLVFHTPQGGGGRQRDIFPLPFLKEGVAIQKPLSRATARRMLGRDAVTRRANGCQRFEFNAVWEAWSSQGL